MNALEKMDFEAALEDANFRAAIRRVFTSTWAQYQHPCVVIYPSFNEQGEIVGQVMMGADGNLILPLLDDVPAKAIARRIICDSDRYTTTPVRYDI
ncbi:MAG: hypothetical protein HC781_22945 [Leptolyngbyaceae cyanobacterium CSU_1_4]|nr:hypothetical protein [Leptolyngbyaceae cyanobacterium CSU_1_4]